MIANTGRLPDPYKAQHNALMSGVYQSRTARTYHANRGTREKIEGLERALASFMPPETLCPLKCVEEILRYLASRGVGGCLKPLIDLLGVDQSVFFENLNERVHR